MALEPPKPGQVIGYRYLWWNEYRQGHEEGVKERPCAVVYSVKKVGDTTRVYVLPITHTKPLKSEDGIELLPQWKQHLGLDSQPSWVITSELNHFEWPGVDIRGTSTEAISYGFLPHKVTTRLREMIRERVARKRTVGIDRDFKATKSPDPKHKSAEEKRLAWRRCRRGPEQPHSGSTSVARPSPWQVYEDPYSAWSYLIQPRDEDLEGQHFDRKEAGRSLASASISKGTLDALKEHVLKTVSAFANSNAEGGLLVIGISSQGEVLGVDHLDEDQKNSLTNLNTLVRNHAAEAEVKLHDCQVLRLALKGADRPELFEVRQVR